MKTTSTTLTKALACCLLTVVLPGCSPKSESTAPPPPAVAATTPNPAEEAVTIDVCGEPVRYERIPQRVVTHDVNITELFMALDLGHLLVGYSGLRAYNKFVAPEYSARLAEVPSLSERDMNLEAIVDLNTDFVFAGWNYGFMEGAITPESLKRFGIDSYILSESCIRIGERTQVSVEDTFTDLINLGRIFRVEERAETLVAQQRGELAEISSALEGIDHRPRVFVYDSGVAIPATAGRFAMPNAMIETAGGTNIFNDINSSWVNANWEDVVDRDPEWIVIIDYDTPDAQGKIDFLLSKPELAHISAIKEKRFLVLEYAEATPGPRNVARTRSLAQAFHPERLPKPAPAL